MAGEWPTLSLREANVTLIDCDHRTPPASEAGYPYVAIPQLRGGRVDLSDVRRIKREHFLEWTRKARPSANDVILSRRCNPGETAVVPPDLEFALGQNLVLLRADGTKVYPSFLRWLVRGPEWWDQIGKFLNVGAVFDSLRCADVPNFELRIPPVPEQRAIAHILGALDDKIELNRRMSETLEAMARALFKSWFVDFDPVRAKAEGHDPGLPQPLANLFPDSFEDSALGEIPKGWKVGTLGDLIDTVKGRSYKSEELAESDTALVTLKSFARGGGYRPDGLKSFTGTYKPEQVVQPGDLVIACTDVTQAAEVIGRPAIVRGTGAYQRLVASLDTVIVRPRDSIMTRSFLYFLGGTDAFVAHTFAHTTGTTVLHLAKEAVPSFMFARPSTQLVKQFDALAGPALDRIQALEEDSGTLAALRDTLLPKLISGELRISETRRILAGIDA